MSGIVTVSAGDKVDIAITGLIGFDVGTGSWIVRPELPQTR